MSSGERQGGREHIDRTTDYLIKRGGLRPDVAHEQAKKARIRNEQRGDGDRK